MGKSVWSLIMAVCLLTICFGKVDGATEDNKETVYSQLVWIDNETVAYIMEVTYWRNPGVSIATAELLQEDFNIILHKLRTQEKRILWKTVIKMDSNTDTATRENGLYDGLYMVDALAYNPKMKLLAFGGNEIVEISAWGQGVDGL
jgi:hypothetical protein